jgi:hypothetical protein
MSVLLTLCLLFTDPPAAAEPTTPGTRGASTPDSDWDAAFTRTSGWTGGDVAGSIDLGVGSTLWVFGDSWIGDIAKGKHAPGSRLVNNSIAVHDWNPEKSRAGCHCNKLHQNNCCGSKGLFRLELRGRHHASDATTPNPTNPCFQRCYGSRCNLLQWHPAHLSR